MGKYKKIKKGALSKTLSAPVLQRIDEMMEQLSERHAAALRTIAQQEKQRAEQLEQLELLSQRHETSIQKIWELEQELDAKREQLSKFERDTGAKLKQLSDRYAAILGKLAGLEKEMGKKSECRGTRDA